MATNVANLAWKSTGGTLKRTNAVRNAERFNVKDFGATGDGSTDDRAAIQAAIDYVSAGFVSNPTQEIFCRGSLYFPPGNYRCNTSTTGAAAQGVLVVNWGQTYALREFCMYGDNSATTRIFYDGALLNRAVDGNNTILLNFDNYVQGSYVRGLHFDMTPATGGALDPTASPVHADVLCVWNRGRQTRAGSDQTWYDCKFTGAVWGLGISGEGASQGAENVYLFCKFDDCYQGWRTFSSNALDHNLIGGYAKNCTGIGVVAGTGAVCTVVGMEFSGNAPDDGTDLRCGDIASQNNNPVAIIGNTSTSQDHVIYANGCSYFAANYHHASVTGKFYLSKNNAVFDANYSTKGRITNPGHGGDGGPTEPDPTLATVCLRANRFDDASYLTGWTGQVVENI